MEINSSKLRVVFCGSPASAVPFLHQLEKKESVVGIITQPDKKSGRGHAVHQTLVAENAPHTTALLKPALLRDPHVYQWLKDLRPDIGVVVAYGKIFPQEILSIPRCGFINVHFSLLPRYRGPAPIQHALLNNESETGMTVFQLEKTVDTGPIYVQKKISLTIQDDYSTVLERLIEIGKQALEETLHMVKKGMLKPLPQIGESSQSPLIKKEQGLICWGSTSGKYIYHQIRAFNVWPCAYTHMSDGSVLKIIKAELSAKKDTASIYNKPGTVIDIVKGKGFIVQCTDVNMLITQVIPEGKKAMSGWDLVNGRKIKVGDIL